MVDRAQDCKNLHHNKSVAEEEEKIDIFESYVFTYFYMPNV